MNMDTQTEDKQLHSSAVLAQPKARSYEIFMSFVKYHQNGECDTTGMISKTCYAAWLSTRVPVPKKPEESFRRSLLGILTGCDQRKPFPPKVESSILNVLRKKEIWPCFRDLDCKIGLRGIKNRGYHESRISPGMDPNRIHEEAIVLNNSRAHDTSMVTSGSINNEYLILLKSVEMAHLSSNEEMPIAVRRLAASITGNILPDAFIGLLRSVGPDYFNGELYRSLELMDAEQDIRLQTAFLVPAAFEFDKMRNVGTLILERDFNIVDANLDVQILGESLISKNWIGISASRMQSALLIIYELPVLRQFGTAWSRKIVRLPSGLEKMLDIKTNLIPGNRMQVMFQDSSHLYAPILNRARNFV
eukprot:CAMPEP_0204832554 /NCGR_PEP_ID=MMETSP1346-20131115/14161_1 /ASSEMBLY_ACC=CAM_ASM_000771 /TAXON_ID=215587 /ORGANISM="Aplanochytrium stocchinoi, Strain GSBS06" /LENGTH=360 /DNA_ID=CAMNT_0051964461 /DNA_START=333 /DNA_END=1415 /DNA_ORIENTATION=+